jgi:hypothetical protein
MAGSIYMILYLVLSFLIIVNMYIAVILENYSQVHNQVNYIYPQIYPPLGLHGFNYDFFKGLY